MRRLGSLCILVCLLVTLVTGVSALDSDLSHAEASNTNSVTFSRERGYITGPVVVTLSGPGEILYSLDWGSEWTSEAFAPVARRYSGPIVISGTTQLRAMAAGDAHVVSHTYIDISGYTADEQAVIQSYPYATTSGEGLGTKYADDPTIVELKKPDDAGISAPAGVRAREPVPHDRGSYRFYFRSGYGDGRLDYDVFPDAGSGAQTPNGHDKLDLDQGGRDALGSLWSQDSCTPSPGTMMRSPFFKQLQRRLGGDGASSAYYLSWQRDQLNGLFIMSDVPHHGFMDEHFGGSKQAYGVWTQFRHELPVGNPYSSGDVKRFMQAVDLRNYADYLLVSWLSANVDMARQHGTANVTVAGLFNGPYYHWVWEADATDRALCDLEPDVGPEYLGAIALEPDFRMLLTDRVTTHFTNGGAMTDTALAAAFDELASELRPALPLIYQGDWERPQMSLEFRINRAAGRLHAWLRQHGFVSPLPAVGYSLDTGVVAPGSSLTLTGGDEIWFSIDGQDPRVPGGEVAEFATRYEAPIDLPDGTVQVTARVKRGATWGPAQPMIFVVGEPSLVITEATTEYIEITNTGSTSVDLEYWRLQGDVRYKFQYNSSPVVAPGESVVVVEDAEAFVARWNRLPDGEFLEDLNGTDTLRLLDPNLVVHHETESPLHDDGKAAGTARAQWAAEHPSLILNEWNAVTAQSFADAADPRLGSVKGNGGDWFELVAVADSDIREWEFEATDGDGIATIRLTDDPVWENVPVGAIITISEEPLVGEDGTIYTTDTAIAPEAGDWWIHVVTNEENPYVESVKFPVTAKNWTLAIRNADREVQWGPAGEGLSKLPFGVASTEVGELEAHPTPGLKPQDAPFDDSKGSTFGLPNTFHGKTQDFSSLRREVLANYGTCTVGDSSGFGDGCDE